MTMIEVDTFEHAGLTVRIAAEEYIDENDNPRTNCDGNIGVMFCEHPSYTLGDPDAEDPRGHSCGECDGDGTKDCEGLEDCPNCDDGTLSITDYLKSIGCRVALPLFLYDHSGITMSCGANLLTGSDNFDRRGRYAMDGAGWDTSSVGVIYHSPELCERWGRPETDDAKIEEELRNEVATYATYLEGGVYYYQVLDADGEVLDSCGGFLDGEIFKDDSYTKQEARWAAESCAEDIKHEREVAHEWACRDVVTTN